jgi:hypothetical protein
MDIAQKLTLDSPEDAEYIVAKVKLYSSDQLNEIYLFYNIFA